MTKTRFWYNFKQILLIVAASLATAVAVEIFLLPADSLVGGALSVASILDILLGKSDPVKWYFSAGLWQLAINVPILVYCFVNYRKRFALKTMFYVLFLAVFLLVLRIFNVADVVKDVMSSAETGFDKVLYVIIGGALHGVSLPIMLSVSASTGGSDIVGLIVQRHSRRSSSDAMRWIFLTNIIVLTAASVVYYFVSGKNGNEAVNMFVYSVAAMFTCEIVQETIFKGFSSALELEVTTDKPEEMANALKDGLKHGVTNVKVVGGYSHAEKTLILCVIHKGQLTKARRIINHIDPSAFAYVENVREVLGKGFANKENDLENDSDASEK